MFVLVCTWDPKHTLARKQAQESALRQGVIAAIVQECGDDRDSLSTRMAPYVSWVDEDGEKVCADCGGLMENVLARPDIVDPVVAMEEVAENFEDAIQRTRSA